MAENKVAAAGVGSSGGVRDTVCIHTRKIYSSCRDKDCIEDLRFYPTGSAQNTLNAAQSIRGGRAELIYTYVDVEPVNFNRGFYTVDMRFFYRIVLQVMTGGARYTEVEGLATFDKRVILYGSEGNAKIYTSRPVFGGPDIPAGRTANLPIAVVEAVDPLLLSARIVDGRCGCDNAIGGVPQQILEAFDEPLTFENVEGARKVCISLGQFSLVRLERDTQLQIPGEYCIPSGECTAIGGTSTGEDPCELFEGVEFPLNEFFPPNNVSGAAGCCCNS